jgi:hypothetical protein
MPAGPMTTWSMPMPEEHNEPNDEEYDPDKEARRLWKLAHPGDTIKRQEKLKEIGAITELPWQTPEYYEQIKLEADNSPAPLGTVTGFGTQFPLNAVKGNMFLRTDILPSLLYKYNGTKWMEVDKNTSTSYAYDDAYIDHLIEKLSTGEYDADLLNDAERDRIEQRLNEQSK